MLTQSKTKPESQDEIAFYCLIGEAMCVIQHLEDAISHAIALKKHVRHPRNISRDQADAYLEKYRSYTLGKAINLTRAERLFGDQLQQQLEALLSERNWLVHKSVAQNRDEVDTPEGKEKLFQRVKSITKQTQILLHAIEEDLIQYSEAMGMNMSNVRAAIRQHYEES